MSVEMASQTMGFHEQKLFGLPVNRDILFSNHKNVYKQRIEKRQTKLTKKISFIKPFLKDDEEILLVTTGCSPISFLDQLLTGWVVFYLKRSVFVFTNKRILHIPTKMNYSYRNSISQILYTDCQTITVRGRKLMVNYKNGDNERFLYIPRNIVKKLKAMLKSISLEGVPGKAQKRVHLCPCCTKELEEGKYTCPHCNLVFKDKGEAKKISLLYPGGGYFYTRHPFLGVGDALTEFILLILVIVSLVEIMKGNQTGFAALIFYGIVLTVEKAITVYHSNHFVKEYITMEKEINPITLST